VNRTTKERQWKHPGKAAAEAAGASSNTKTRRSSVSKPGATKATDESAAKAGGKGGRVTTGETTEEVRTIERLSSRLKKTDLNKLQSMIAESEESTNANDEYGADDGMTNTSNPIKSSHAKATKSRPAQPPAPPAKAAPVLSREDKVRAAKAANYPPLSPEELSAEVAFGDLSITRMEYLGVETKSGFLMKQSSLLGL
jgi:hypothetical protein